MAGVASVVVEGVDAAGVAVLPLSVVLVMVLVTALPGEL